MNIFSFITLIGGLAFFLYGMHTLSAGLERMAGGSLERSLKKITSNRIRALVLGAGITAAIQSSSAVTVMLVGLVNSGIMTISNSIGVIMGSNIGTTMTAWVLTLVGLETDNVVISLLKPENFSLIFAFVGVMLIMGAKTSKKKDIGTILVGFAVLMYGMKLMSSAVKPLAEIPEFTSLLLAFKNPVLGVLVGLFITAVIQSSSASVGILQALALTGSVSYGAAIPIIMGQNIGTCITALISSLGVGRNAKKVAVVHITFNIIGTAICLTAYCLLNSIIHLSFTDASIDAIGIAAIHSLFNVFTTFMLVPFTKQIERFANYVMRDVKEEAKTHLLDDRLLVTPSVALSECDAITIKMAATARETVLAAIRLTKSYDKALAEIVLEKENDLDKYEDELGSFLVKLSAKKLSDSDSRNVSKMLHSIGDFERLGDHAVNILKVAEELHEKKLNFSDKAKSELGVLTDAIEEILDMSIDTYRTNDTEKATLIEPLEQVIDSIVSAIKTKHIKRLQAGDCSIELGFILSDLLGNYERVSDHCSNIAVSVIEISKDNYDTHKYLQDIKYNSEVFKKRYEEYSLKYGI